VSKVIQYCIECKNFFISHPSSEQKELMIKYGADTLLINFVCSPCALKIE